MSGSCIAGVSESGFLGLGDWRDGVRFLRPTGEGGFQTRPYIDMPGPLRADTWVRPYRLGACSDVEVGYNVARKFMGEVRLT